MRIAVAGGTGQVGRHTVQTLAAEGHDVVVLSRSAGVDLTSGAGVADALARAEAVVDATSTPSMDRDEVLAFFGAATRSLLDGGRAAGVRHHVLLSILAMDPATENPHQQGKLRQEALVREGGVPYTIVRAPQFFEFAELLAGWTRDGDRATVPPLRVRAAAAADVGAALAQVAADAPRDGVREVVGPEVVDLADVAQRAAAARGDALTVEGSWAGSPLDAVEPPAPAADALVTPTGLDAWLASLR